MFVHQTEIRLDGFRALYPEQTVEFSVEQTGPSGRPCATNVTGSGGKNLEGRSRRRVPTTAPVKASGNASTVAPSADAAAAQPAGDAEGATRGRGRARGRGRGGRARGRSASRPRPPLNSAFVFVKPHANTDKVKDLVRSTLVGKGLRVIKEGSLSAEEIDEKKLIDQHYYSIASKATILKPSQLVVPDDKFSGTFGISWQKALESGNVYNAMDGCKYLEIDAQKLDELWGLCKKNNKLVKLGGGFYCGLVEVQGKTPVYIFNGFFMSMRAKFTAPGTSIYYFVVTWPASKLSWSDFRGKVLGKTDPAEGPADSLRGILFNKWKDFDLKEVPNTGDNGVHASASPFEALAERINWLGATVSDDRFGQILTGAGVSEDTINDWTRDPQVNTEEGSKSLFDSLEDLDAAECVDKCKKLAGVKA